MAKRYKLPDALGGGECAFHAKGYDPENDTWIVMLWTNERPTGIKVEVRKDLLTEVEDPLPEEPPFGALVATGTMANPLPIWRRWMDTGWDEVGAKGAPSRTWAEVCLDSMQRAGRPPIRLVPHPFAESVALPWKTYDVEVAQTHDEDKPGNHVYVSTKPARYGFAHLKPDVAREMARALWAAADQAEAAS